VARRGDGRASRTRRLNKSAIEVPRSAVIARAKLDNCSLRATNRHTATLLEAHLEGAA
jgi:hypothetical protein